MEIRGRLLYRGIQHPDGSIISNECKIEIPEKVPIICESNVFLINPDAVMGFATITEDNLGLIFTGYIRDDIPKYPGCGGYYTKVKRTKSIPFGPDYHPPFTEIVNSMSLKYIMLVSKPVNPDYVYSEVKNGEAKGDEDDYTQAELS